MWTYRVDNLRYKKEVSIRNMKLLDGFGKATKIDMEWTSVGNSIIIDRPKSDSIISLQAKALENCYKQEHSKI